MFRALIYIVLTISALMFTAGCSDDANEEPKPLTAKEQYVVDVRDSYPKAKGMTDSELVDLGKEMCKILDRGYTFQGILLSGAQSGITQKDMASFLKVSVPVFCPQHTKAMGINLP